MSDTILGGDFTIYWLAEDRQKRIEWTGSSTGTHTINELYSAWLKKMSQLTKMSEGTPMFATTDAEYKIGMFDAGDKDPWFIDRTTAEHLTGTTGLPMSLRTVGWTRTQDSNVGIVKVGCSSTSFNLTSGDIGDTCTHGDGDTGTILDVNTSTYEVWIRPSTDGSSDNWDSTSGTITADTSSNTATQNAAAVSGECIWAGVESIGNLETNTRPYVYQDGSEVTAYKGTDKWWLDGQINTNFLVQEMGTLIDEGYIEVIAHQFTKLHAYWQLDLSNGKPKPAPLTTGVEPRMKDPLVGYRQFLTNAATGSWGSSDVGSVIQEVSNTDNKAIITSISGTSPNFTVQYYPIGSLEDFEASDVIEDTGQTKTMTLTAAAPTNVGPAALSGLSLTYGSNNSYDIDEDGTNEYYSIVFDVSDESLGDAFEWLKYITTRGQTSTTNTNGVEAESYKGIDFVITYTSMTGTVSEGDVVTQVNTGATGTVVAIHTTPKVFTVRSSRGDFVAGSDDIQKDGSNYFVDPTQVSKITPIQSCAFGTMPGSSFSAAQGLVPINVPAADSNNYTLTDDLGNSVAVPNKVAVNITDTRLDDKLAIYELDASGGYIKKDFYTVDTIASVGDTTISVDPIIDSKVPGKSAGGVLFVVDLSNNVEYRYRYTSWTGDDFTLFNVAQSTATGGDSDSLIDTGADFVTDGVKVGDIIFNSTEGVVAYVLEIVSSTELRTTEVTSWSGDTYRIGAIAVALAVNDEIYVPYMNVHETSGSDASPGSESIEVVYSSDIPIVMIARNSEDGGSYNIEPFAIYGTIGSTGFSQAVIRSSDDIIT